MAYHKTFFTMGNSLILDLPAPVAVICHDAGAANHIVAWLKTLDTLEGVRAHMDGPAVKIWQTAFPDINLIESVEEALDRSGSLLSGTGWASNLEHDARRLARQEGIQSVAMVDHWGNYLSRFVRGAEQVLPDEIWVVDDYAYVLAEEIFSSCKVQLKPDNYSQILIRSVQPFDQVSGNELLYVLEPMRSNWGRGRAGEFQALDYLLGRISELTLPDNLIIRLRPHPSDQSNKYDNYLLDGGPHRIILDDGDLDNAISRAKWVAGCESFALTLALKAGRPVFCTLPPWAPPCRLPHSGLIHIKDM